MSKIEKELKSREIFQFVSIAIGVALFLSGLFGEKYSLVGLLPIYIGGACIAYIFKFSDIATRMTTPFIILSVIFMAGEWGDIQHRIAEERMIRSIQKICSNRVEIRNTIGCDEILSEIMYFEEPPDNDYEF